MDTDPDADLDLGMDTAPDTDLDPSMDTAPGTDTKPSGTDTKSGMEAEPFDFDGDYGRAYEDLAHRVIPGYRTLFPMVAALADPALPPGGRLLVVGAGTGIELATFRRARPDLHLTGLDPSAQMLALARRRLAADDDAPAEGRPATRPREAGRNSAEEEAAPHPGSTNSASGSDAAPTGPGSVELRLGLVRDLPVRPRFHAATIINVLHFLPDDGEKAALLKAVADRLRAGGLLVLFDLHGEPGAPEHERAMEAWRRYWRIMNLAEEEIPRFEERISTGIHFASAQRIADLAEQAGFGPPRRFFQGLLYGGWTFTRDM